MKKAILYCVAIIFASLIATLFLPFSCAPKAKNDEKFDIVMDKISDDTLVTEVRMLGAHDAFSSDIGYMSRANPNQDDLITSGIVNKFAKGVVVRFSKAQNGSALDLLNGGVRYFDTRITLSGEDFYTCHGYLSNNFDYYLKDIIDFLDSHPSEFVILDIQEYFASGTKDGSLEAEDWDKLLLHLSETKGASGKTIIDFIRYDAKVDALKDLTVGQVTNNKNSGGVVILAKTSDYSEFYLRDSNADYNEEREYTSIRSYWHETNSTDELISGIDNEEAFVEKMDYSGLFVVNQAQKTAFIMSGKLVRSIFGWSLTKMASKFNKELVKDEERFNKWLDEMPILMVDYALSSKGDFNKLANTYIIAYNSK